ncbi:MAG: hypothetical protein E6I76_01120, partial [Chloroflexi bacterium]
MPLTDLLRALPALLVVGIVPGFALATLIVPGWRWWERLAGAPGLSAGLAGVIGLAYHDLHVPLWTATVLPLEVAVVAAAVWRARRHATSSAAEAHPAGRRIVVAGALCAGIVSAVVLAAGYRDLPVPVATDGPVHADVAAGIAARHDILPVLPDPSGGQWVRPRAGVEAVAALASELGGPSAPAALLPFTVVAVLLLPLGLAALALETTGSTAIAALAPLLGVGWAFPSVRVPLRRRCHPDRTARDRRGPSAAPGRGAAAPRTGGGARRGDLGGPWARGDHRHGHRRPPVRRPSLAELASRAAEARG